MIRPDARAPQLPTGTQVVLRVGATDTTGSAVGRGMTGRVAGTEETGLEGITI
ncbi:hypothetical protein [Actinopolymorpha alba]|uniref:hypothetical protein n=1 Tax=Actinopolymorpha alba TaxID=533267 RepID=UPI0012F6C1EE|nr:hypothetical protein [Actinopolymorpha alba]